MKLKRCKECGGMYDPKDKKVVLMINHKDIEAIEDIFFCDNKIEQYRQMKPRLCKVWKQICNGEEKWDENKRSYQSFKNDKKSRS